MIREVEGHRAYTARKIDRWERRGKITPEQAEELLAEMEAHLEDEQPAPTLPLGLATIYDAWHDLGRPIAVIQGLAGGVIDCRAPLYVSRLAWLDERRLRDQDDRDAVMKLWSALDRTETEMSMKRLAAAAERMAPKSE